FSHVRIEHRCENTTKARSEATSGVFLLEVRRSVRFGAQLWKAEKESERSSSRAEGAAIHLLTSQ
ncbi:MAG: hypothetical protein AAGE86_13255, partial [Pseudomonadota bacterium]